MSAEVATEVTAPALVEVGYELGRMASLPPSRRGGGGDRAVPRGHPGAVDRDPGRPRGDALTALLADGLDVTWLREHPARLAEVTPDEVHEAASTLLAPAAMVTTVVGDADAVGDTLAAVTEVARR